ncbi:hypothetical protein AB0E69_31965 [Kribbella sp. NPDC026611]|uniref:hypothetical protein n=1 Tax=Kribbella sp. NPDC026611 TaxID=3154911 RepID=UPI0033D73864
MIPLAWYDILLDAVNWALKTFVGGLITMLFQPILDAIANAVGLIMSTIGTFWIYVPTIAVGDGNGHPANGTIDWVWGHTSFIAVFIAAIGVVVGGMRMAWSQRGEEAREILKSLLTLATASVFAISVAQVLVEVGDKFSDCIVTTALAKGNQGWVCGLGAGGAEDFGKAMITLLGFTVAAAGPLGVGLLITIGILCVIAGVIQIVLMVVRSAMLILLIGVLPIAAAATNTEMGKQWFKKIVAWLAAFILYKPVAAIVYATAIRLTTNNGDLSFDANDIGNQIMNMVTGVTMLVLALFALPALMRFIVPMVAATAGAAGAGALAAKMLGGVAGQKMAEHSQNAVGETSGEGSNAEGPSGAQNVGRPKPNSQGPSGGGEGGGGGAPEGAEGAAGGGEGGAAAAAGGEGGAAAAAGGGGGGGAAAAAGGGAAAAAPPLAAAAALYQAGKAAHSGVKHGVKEAFAGDSGEIGQGDGGGGGGGGGQGGGGGGGGPSGAGGSPQQDPGRSGSYRQQRNRDEDRRQLYEDRERQNRMRDDGPSGS